MKLNEGQQRAIDRITHDAYAGGGNSSPESDVRYLLWVIDELCSEAAPSPASGEEAQTTEPPSQPNDSTAPVGSP